MDWKTRKTISFFISCMMVVMAMILLGRSCSKSARADGMQEKDDQVTRVCSYLDDAYGECDEDLGAIDSQVQVAIADTMGRTCDEHSCLGSILIEVDSTSQTYWRIETSTDVDRRALNTEDAREKLEEDLTLKLVPTGHHWHGTFSKLYEQQIAQMD